MAYHPLESYFRDSDAPARFARIVLAVSMRGTMYSGVPAADGGFRIRRFRSRGPLGNGAAELEGMLAAVEVLREDDACPAEQLVACEGMRFRVVPGCFGMPVVGKRLVAGRADSRIEVSTPIRWMRTFLPEKESFLDAIFDAFAAGDLAWLDYADQAAKRSVERKAA